jgi:hypothetical protein
MLMLRAAARGGGSAHEQHADMLRHAAMSPRYALLMPLA